MTRCSICHTRIGAEDPRTPCPQCRQEYHSSCWDELGGCATYGCAAAVQPEKPPPPGSVGGGWGDEKKCPACRKLLASSLLRCSCGAAFPSADPMTPAEYIAWRDEERKLSRARKTLVVLFLLSMLGLPSPVLGPFAGYYAYRTREHLIGADGTYVALGYGTAALGGTYGLTLLLLLLGF